MIELRHLCAGFGGHEILHGIDATVAERCVTAVMGPNGCGKTTLLRCIGGLLRPTAGGVLVDGQPVDRYTPRQLARRLAFVHQRTQADFDFTAEQIVMMGRNPYQGRLQGESSDDLAAVEQAMRQTGTWHLRHALPSSMSGGELQRVMIARAIAQQTPLLLMDEPVANLDIAHQIETMRMLRSGNWRSVLIVIHDLNLALRYCDRLLLLHRGRTLFHGPTAEGLTPENIRTVYGVGARIVDGYIQLHPLDEA